MQRRQCKHMQTCKKLMARAHMPTFVNVSDTFACAVDTTGFHARNSCLTISLYAFTCQAYSRHENALHISHIGSERYCSSSSWHIHNHACNQCMHVYVMHRYIHTCIHSYPRICTTYTQKTCSISLSHTYCGSKCTPTCLIPENWSYKDIKNCRCNAID